MFESHVSLSTDVDMSLLMSIDVDETFRHRGLKAHHGQSKVDHETPNMFSLYGNFVPTTGAFQFAALEDHWMQSSFRHVVGCCLERVGATAISADQIDRVFVNFPEHLDVG